MIDVDLLFSQPLTEEEAGKIRRGLAIHDDQRNQRESAIKSLKVVTAPRLHEKYQPDDLVYVQYVDREAHIVQMTRELAERLGLIRNRGIDRVGEIVSSLRSAIFTEDQAKQLHRAIDGRTRPQPETATPTLPERHFPSQDIQVTQDGKPVCLGDTPRATLPLESLRGVSDEVARAVCDLGRERNISNLYGMGPRDVKAIGPLLADVLAGVGDARYDAPSKPDLCGNG